MGTGAIDLRAITIASTENARAACARRVNDR
jgi:hypothetical protein